LALGKQTLTLTLSRSTGRGDKRVENRVGDGLRILQYLIVWKSQYPNAHSAKCFRSLSVIFRVRRVEVLSSIELDGKLRSNAEEIDDEAADWILSPELEVRELSIAKDVPHLLFGVCRFVAHTPGELE
jgi:hypothetical protein